MSERCAAIPSVKGTACEAHAAESDCSRGIVPRPQRATLQRGLVKRDCGFLHATADEAPAPGRPRHFQLAPSPRSFPHAQPPTRECAMQQCSLLA
mmetsp:Transcript_34253/g.105834  ORF Transcript_34253/g.105834 Transcript_34253/m.105834 type:complete len:95 (-) Transcript_34253:241-525(-)